MTPLSPRFKERLRWMENESRYAHACPDLDQEFPLTEQCTHTRMTLRGPCPKCGARFDEEGELESSGLRGASKEAHREGATMRASFEPRHESGSDTGWIQTFTGGKFWPLEPRAEDVRIEDVAHALAYQCRYAGHATRFYSVAEHCCLLADYVIRMAHTDQWCETPMDACRTSALTALLHDAAEAYLPDLARPLKHRMPEWRAADAALEAVVVPALGGEHPIPGWMKLLDARILRDERPVVMRETGESWQVEDLEPLGVWVRGIPPHESERWFLDLYSELREK